MANAMKTEAKRIVKTKAKILKADAETERRTGISRTMEEARTYSNTKKMEEDRTYSNTKRVITKMDYQYRNRVQRIRPALYSALYDYSSIGALWSIRKEQNEHYVRFEQHNEFHRG